MKLSNAHIHLRTQRAEGYATLLALPALLLWLVMPLGADVIDDFSEGRKFSLYARDRAPEWEIVDGQLHFGLPASTTYGSFWYLQTHELPEGQPVEFRLDVVSLNDPNVAAGLAVIFCSPPDAPRGAGRAYDLFYLRGRVALVKGSEAATYHVFDSSCRGTSDPVTLLLTLTRQGDNLKVGTKVVRRDDPLDVLFQNGDFTDTPSVQGTGDNGAPPAGPVTGVGVMCETVNGAQVSLQAVFDNLECSAAPTPRFLEIQRPAGLASRLEWRSWSILLEASGLGGPWRPWPEVACEDGGAYGVSIPLSESARFFRVARGSQRLDNFGTFWDFTSWKTAPMGGGQGRRPGFVMVNGHGRLRGLGNGNQDFFMYWGFSDVPAGESVASVDILDWDETMEDAAFGLLLRVKSEKDVWLPGIEGLPHDRYAGLLTFKKAGSPSESVLSLTGPGGEPLEIKRFPAVDPAKQYRLRFWAVGDRLTLELFSLDDLSRPIETCEAIDGRVPEGVGEALYGTKSASGTYDVTIDRFFSSCAMW